MLIGELGRAREVLDEATGAASALGDARLGAMTRLADRSLRLNTDPEIDVEEVLEEVGAVIDAFGAAEDHIGLAKAWRTLGVAYWMLARADRTAHAMEAAIEHARRAGDPKEESEAMVMLALCAWSVGTVENGFRLCERLLAEAGPNQRVRAFATLSKAILLGYVGRFGEARRLDAEATQVLEEIGASLELAASRFGTSMIEVLAGNPERAAGILLGSFEALQAMNETAYLSTMASELANLFCDLGRFEDAERYARISEEAAAAADLASQVGWRVARGRAYAATGRQEEGLELLRDATRIAERTDFFQERGRAREELARVLRRMGRTDEARARLLEAIALYERRGLTAHLERARGRLESLDEGS
jgi:tetratricopeptide (TPR) repeat protein